MFEIINIATRRQDSLLYCKTYCFITEISKELYFLKPHSKIFSKNLHKTCFYRDSDGIEKLYFLFRYTHHVILVPICSHEKLPIVLKDNWY